MNTIPTLLWIYATALIPLAFLANRELDDEVTAESGLVLCAVACALLTMPSISSVQPPAMISAVIGLVGVAALFNLALTSRQLSDGKPVRPPSEEEIRRSIEEKGIGAIEEMRKDAA